MPGDATANVLIAGSFTKANAAHLAHKSMLSRAKANLTSRSFSAPAARRGFVSPSASNVEVFLHAAYARCPPHALPRWRTVLTARREGDVRPLSAVVGVVKRPTTGDSLRLARVPGGRLKALVLSRSGFAEGEFGLVVHAPYRPAGHSALRRLG
jgi:hypothetical protein